MAISGNDVRTYSSQRFTLSHKTTMLSFGVEHALQTPKAQTAKGREVKFWAEQGGPCLVALASAAPFAAQSNA